MDTPEILTFLTLYNNIPQGAKPIFDNFVARLQQAPDEKKDTANLVLRLCQYILELDLCPEDKVFLIQGLAGSMCSRRLRV